MEELTPEQKAVRDRIHSVLEMIYPNDFEIDQATTRLIHERLMAAIEPWDAAPSPEVFAALASVFGGYACALVKRRKEQN